MPSDTPAGKVGKCALYWLTVTKATFGSIGVQSEKTGYLWSYAKMCGRVMGHKNKRIKLWILIQGVPKKLDRFYIHIVHGFWCPILGRDGRRLRNCGHWPQIVHFLSSNHWTTSINNKLQSSIDLNHHSSLWL